MSLIVKITFLWITVSVFFSFASALSRNKHLLDDYFHERHPVCLRLFQPFFFRLSIARKFPFSSCWGLFFVSLSFVFRLHRPMSTRWSKKCPRLISRSRAAFKDTCTPSSQPFPLLLLLFLSESDFFRKTFSVRLRYFFLFRSYLKGKKKSLDGLLLS